MNDVQRIIIVGGVAAGASAAARARRLCEDCEILLLERGPEPSFANCGLPYYVGGVIPSRDRLLVAPIDRLRQRYRLDVRVHADVQSIDRQAQQVNWIDRETGDIHQASYDKLILATGASPLRPPLPGIDSKLVLELRDLQDADRMHALASNSPSSTNPLRAVVIGAGFIGMEVAENLIHRGIDVTIVERNDQILPPWDSEMVGSLQKELTDRGAKLLLMDAVESFHEREGGNGLSIQTSSGQALDADFAVICIGVQPENRLAVEAGLAVGSHGGVITNEQMQTSDPNIYAAGDVVEVMDFVFGEPTQVPLAGPANRQGRIAANHIMDRDTAYRGTQGTAILGLFEKTIAMTGWSEKRLRRSGIEHEKIYIHPSDHAGYYPGAQPLTLKLIFDPNDGRIFGAQAVGTRGVDKRIDVISMAIQAGLRVMDLEEAELCYAPQYGHAKDPINMAGFVASSIVRGDQRVVHIEDLDDESKLLIDVRTPPEFDAGHIPRAVNLPLETLRDQMDQLPTDQSIITYCQVGQRGYMANRILLQRGLDAANLSGGYKTWQQFQERSTVASREAQV